MRTVSSQSLQKTHSWGKSWQQLASAWAQTSNSQRVLPTNGSGSGLDRVRHAEYWPPFCGTDLDYVIQASDTDPEGILSVLLTPRTRTAGAITTGRPASPAEQARGAGRRNPQANRGPVEAPSLENSTEPAIPVEVPLAGSPPAAAEQQPASAELQAVPDTSEAEADKSIVKSPEQMIQKLQNMYQQRKQIQQDRNKPPTPN